MWQHASHHTVDSWILVTHGRITLLEMKAICVDETGETARAVHAFHLVPSYMDSAIIEVE